MILQGTSSLFGSTSDRYVLGEAARRWLVYGKVEEVFSIVDFGNIGSTTLLDELENQIRASVGYILLEKEGAKFYITYQPKPNTDRGHECAELVVQVRLP